VVKDAETLALGDLAREAAAALASSIEERGIEVTVPPDLPAVRGDRLRLVQVFQNLLENAIKFMGETAAPRIEIGARATREEVVCSVADNGVGLALVKRIIDVHGGRVWVQSPGPGRGASFFFTLPRPDRVAEKDG
jgi:signal transduction histidine kinase